MVAKRFEDLEAWQLADELKREVYALERFRKRCSDAVAAVAHVIATFEGREEAERDCDERVDVIEGARPRRPQERFQFGEREFDRVEVGTIGRQKPEMRAVAFDRGPDRRLLMHREVIEHHHVAWSQRGHQDLFDICQETRRVDGAIEHGGRAQPLEPQRGNDRVRLPVAARRVIAEPFAPRTAPIAAQQIGGHATLVEEDVLPHIPEGLPRLPVATRGDDVRAALFVGVDRFF
jgi:hypothetical protein